MRPSHTIGGRGAGLVISLRPEGPIDCMAIRRRVWKDQRENTETNGVNGNKPKLELQENHSWLVVAGSVCVGLLSVCVRVLPLVPATPRRALVEYVPYHSCQLWRRDDRCRKPAPSNTPRISSSRGRIASCNARARGMNGVSGAVVRFRNRRPVVVDHGATPSPGAPPPLRQCPRPARSSRPPSRRR